MTKPTKAEPGAQVRVWCDPYTMRELRMVGKLVGQVGVTPFTTEFQLERWIVEDRDQDLYLLVILVRISDNTVATPEDVEAHK